MDGAPAQRGPVGRFFLEPLDDLRAAMESQVVRSPYPFRTMLLMLGAGVISWWVYVPVHELLHALGCYATGGTVGELQIAPEYGGAWFARLLPFVSSGGNYAGRLSGFDTHGSDLVYLATDALPFVLTVVVGVPLLKGCAVGRRPLRFGVAFVLAMAPFYCLTGDYYEMGSILTTRAFSVARGADAGGLMSLRSDDIFRLGGDLWSRPQELGVHSLPAAAMVVGVGLVVGVLLAFATYALGSWFSRLPPVARNAVD